MISAALAILETEAERISSADERIRGHIVALLLR